MNLHLQDQRSQLQQHQSQDKKSTPQDEDTTERNKNYSSSSSITSSEEQEQQVTQQDHAQQEITIHSTTASTATMNNHSSHHSSSTYEELKWNDKPLYCPDDFLLQVNQPNDYAAGNFLKDTGAGVSSSNCNNEFFTSSSVAALGLPKEENGASSTNHPSAPPPPPRIPIHAGKTALLIVDVQPEYWSSCPSVREDFPLFEENMARTIDVARKQRAKIIWVRADYRKHHSPWLVQFERLNGGKRPDTIVELPCDPESEEFKWEEFATPGKCTI